MYANQNRNEDPGVTWRSPIERKECSGLMICRLCTNDVTDDKPGVVVKKVTTADEKSRPEEIEYPCWNRLSPAPKNITTAILLTMKRFVNQQGRK